MSSYDETAVAIDDTQHRLLIRYRGENRIFEPNQIIAVEVLEDNVSLAHTNRGSQLGGIAVGGILLGGVGAIIGGLSGSQRIQERVRSVQLRITTSEFNTPVFDILLLDCPDNRYLEKSNKAYKIVLETARTWHARITALMKLVPEVPVEGPIEMVEESPVIPATATRSLTSDLVELTDLRDRGAITESEFQELKRRIIDTR